MLLEPKLLLSPLPPWASSFSVQVNSCPRQRPGYCSSQSPSQGRERREMWSPLLDAPESIQCCILSHWPRLGHRAIPSTRRTRAAGLDGSPAVPFTNRDCREPFMSARGNNLPHISTLTAKAFRYVCSPLDITHKLEVWKECYFSETIISSVWYLKWKTRVSLVLSPETNKKRNPTLSILIKG